MSVSIKDLFGALQTQLESSLRVVRGVVDHPSAKGTAAEADWIRMLGEYLPQRYRVASGFVVDCDGDVSDQLDVIVFDRQYSPLLFFHGQCIYVPAESVYAVFEVKPEFCAQHVSYAGKKVASVRRLRRTSASIVHAGGVHRQPKPPFRIPGGLLVLNSAWSPSLGEAFLRSLRALSEEQQLDFGCGVGCGSFEARWAGDELESVNVVSQDHALVFFLMRLLAHLQQLGTAPALVVDEYARWAGEPTALVVLPKVSFEVRMEPIGGEDSRTAEWRSAVAKAAPKLEGPRGVELRFTLSPGRQVDLDNLVRPVMAALQDAGWYTAGFPGLLALSASLATGSPGVSIREANAGYQLQTPTLSVRHDELPPADDASLWKAGWQAAVALAIGQPLDDCELANIVISVNTTRSLVGLLKPIIDGLGPWLGDDPSNVGRFAPRDDRVARLFIHRVDEGPALMLRGSGAVPPAG